MLTVAVAVGADDFPDAVTDGGGRGRHAARAYPPFGTANNYRIPVIAVAHIGVICASASPQLKLAYGRWARNAAAPVMFTLVRPGLLPPWA
jgi:hypothetical protein